MEELKKVGYEDKFVLSSMSYKLKMLRIKVDEQKRFSFLDTFSAFLAGMKRGLRITTEKLRFSREV